MTAGGFVDQYELLEAGRDGSQIESELERAEWGQHANTPVRRRRNRFLPTKARSVLITGCLLVVAVSIFVFAGTSIVTSEKGDASASSASKETRADGENGNGAELSNILGAGKVKASEFKADQNDTDASTILPTATAAINVTESAADDSSTTVESSEESLPSTTTESTASDDEDIWETLWEDSESTSTETTATTTPVLGLFTDSTEATTTYDLTNLPTVTPTESSSAEPDFNQWGEKALDDIKDLAAAMFPDMTSDVNTTIATPSPSAESNPSESEDVVDPYEAKDEAAEAEQSPGDDSTPEGEEEKISEISAWDAVFDPLSPQNDTSVTATPSIAEPEVVTITPSAAADPADPPADGATTPEPTGDGGWNAEYVTLTATSTTAGTPEITSETSIENLALTDEASSPDEDDIVSEPSSEVDEEGDSINVTDDEAPYADDTESKDAEVDEDVQPDDVDAVTVDPVESDWVRLASPEDEITNVDGSDDEAGSDV